MASTQERLRQIMSERNLKQRDILEMSLPYQKKFNIKMGKSALSQYVNGKSSPDQYKLYLLGATLNVDEAWLMGLDVPRIRENSFDTDEKVAEIMFEVIEREEYTDLFLKFVKLPSEKLDALAELIN